MLCNLVLFEPQDLEFLISKAVNIEKADYAVITGVQIHNCESPSVCLSAHLDANPLHFMVFMAAALLPQNACLCFSRSSVHFMIVCACFKIRQLVTRRPTHQLS